MMVFIANELRDKIESSGLKDIEHKSAIGCYEVATFVKNLQKLEFDRLLVDITAIRDASNIDAWDRFKELIDPNKIFVLYDKDNCDSLILSNLVNRGFYNFGGTTDEILHLLEHPNMFADVQKYIIAIPQKVDVVKKEVVEPQTVKQPPQKLIDQNILDEFKAEYKVSYDEVNLVPSQLLCTLLIYAMLVVTTFLEAKVIGSKAVASILVHLPYSILEFVIFALLILVCYCTTIPVIKLARKKTNSVLRFLIVPSLLSLPILLGIVKVITSINSSFELFIYMAGIMLFYIPYMGTLLIRGIVIKLNSENIDVVRWNIFEKMGMFVSIYIFIIPLIEMLLVSFDITIFDGIYSALYFANSDSNVLGIVLLVACIVLSILIIVSRTLSRGRKVKSL